ncbi:putative LPS assembly protein LptD [Bacteroidota bacterium]
MKYFILVIIFSFFNATAQEIDSLINNSPISDLGSTEQDSTNVEEKSKKIDVDDVIYANATDSISFDVQNKKMFIYGKGELKYKKTELTSGNIFIDFTLNELDAEGVVDTSDTINVKYIDTPILNEDAEVYEGNSLKYNFKTQQGFISLAKSGADKSRYEGEKVKKVAKNIYFIEDGIYTTCPSDTPHTYFTASKMKVIQNDKIIGRWIFMHIGGVPFPIPLPFAVFPNKSGRRSGFIIPTYGASGDRGQYFRNFGYFFALSDYMDFTLTSDYYLRGGYGLRGRYRYKKRYDFDGNVNGGFSRVTTGESGDPDRTDRLSWNLNLFHHQDINPTTKLDVNLQFLSSQYLEDNSTRLNDLLKQDIISNATFSKRWDESGNSITINYNRNQNLESGNITEFLPNVTFNKTIDYPFKRKGVSRRDQLWYEYIGYSYSGQFKNERKTIDDDLNIRAGFKHNIRINASPRIGFFNISPSINYSEKWYNKRIKKEYIEELQDDTPQLILKEKTEKGIYFVRTFDFNISASTKIYGMAQPEKFGIAAIRHTLEPRIGYSFKPDFSEDKWNYWDSAFDTSGNEHRYDMYSQGIFGGAGSGESQSINLSLGNVFEIKTQKDPTDTTSSEEKIRILNLNLSTGYNFVADSLNLSDLRMSYRTDVGSILNLSGSSTFSFYDATESRKINKFLISEGKGILRLTNFSANLSTNLTGSKSSEENRADVKQELKSEDDISSYEDSDYIDLYEEDSPDFSIPWNLGLNFNYNYSKPTRSEAIESSSLGLNLSMNLTKNWKITARGSYDIINQELNAPQITIYRDLHCWEMNFVWNPVGRWSGFRFEVRIKAPELRDIKLDKTRGTYSGF